MIVALLVVTVLSVLFAMPGTNSRSADEHGITVAADQRHLRYHRLIYCVSVETAARANPFLRPVTRVVDEALELWADDDAARASGPATAATETATVTLTHSAMMTPTAPTVHATKVGC